MIVVCDRCKERQTEKPMYISMPGWGEIEIKGVGAKEIYLCPKCYSEYKQFMKNEPEPVAPKGEMLCKNCVYLYYNENYLFCAKTNGIVDLYHSCEYGKPAGLENAIPTEDKVICNQCKYYTEEDGKGGTCNKGCGSVVAGFSCERAERITCEDCERYIKTSREDGVCKFTGSVILKNYSCRKAVKRY